MTRSPYAHTRTIWFARPALPLLQLEQLMDASATLGNMSMRRFWKRKIGISKARCPMAELLEVTFITVVEDKC